MTVDTLKVLGQLGQVPPAEPAVLDAALERLEEAIGQDRRPAWTRARAGRPRPWLFTAAVAAAAVSAAAAFVVVTHPDRLAAPARLAGASPPAHRNSATGPAAPTGFAGGTSSGPRVIAAVLTAFSASAGDILAVTKTIRGDFGTVGPTTIWVSPAQAAPGSTVRSRTLNLSLAGARQSEQWLTYTAPTVTQSAADGTCAQIFRRPRMMPSAATGVPGTLRTVNYLFHWWAQGAVTVQAATVPSAAALRACLKSGQWSVTGRGVVHGTKVVDLATPGGYERLWVSAATFLPVRLVFSGPDVDTITFAFSFLPPTAANEALLATSPAPAGFRRLSF
jgi:hypothetical protein